MKFGPKRAHVMFIFENFIKDFGLFLIAVIIFLFVRDINILLDNLFVVILALAGPLSRLVKYFCTKYTIDEECLLVESGWLKKSRLEVPLATISSVDVTQNLLFQLTKVYVLHVENAGSIGNADNGSVKLILGNDDAAIVKAMLMEKQEPQTDEVESVEAEPQNYKTVKATEGEVLTMCAFQIRWIVIGLQMIAYITLGMTFFDDYIFNQGDTSSASMIVEFFSGVATMMIIGIVIGVYLVSVVISTFTSFIKYYNFSVIDRGDSLRIEYGLFTRKSHTLMKEKISGVTYTQSMLMRAMKSGTLQIFVAGYGGLEDGNDEETVLLYPVVKEENIWGFLDWVLPDQVDAPVFEKAEPKGLPYFFLCARFIVSVILCAALVVTTVMIELPWEIAVLGIAVLLLAVASVFMEYRHSAVAYNGKNIIMSNGGFKKNTIVLRREKVEYVEDSASELKRRKRGLSTVKVGVLAPPVLSVHVVRNMSIHVFDEIKGKLIY